jgi:hypothetical protein
MHYERAPRFRRYEAGCGAASARTSAVGELCGRGGRNACCWPVQFARQVQGTIRRITHAREFLLRSARDFFVRDVLCGPFPRLPLSIITITSRHLITPEVSVNRRAVCCPAGKPTGDLQQFCRCQTVTRQTGKAHTSQKRDVCAIGGNPVLMKGYS